MPIAQVTTIAQLAALVGFFLPLVIAVLKQDHFSKRLNTILAAVAVGIAAAVQVANQTGFTWHRWGVAAVTIFTVAGSMYKNLWYPTGLEPAIQTATSVKQNTNPAP